MQLYQAVYTHACMTKGYNPCCAHMPKVEVIRAQVNMNILWLYSITCISQGHPHCLAKVTTNEYNLYPTMHMYNTCYTKVIFLAPSGYYQISINSTKQMKTR